ncbi:hypothetical protein SAMN05720762_10571 [Fibrobacter sp. UWH4]|nr:hypothetical protein SAMN05720762_10571 [Fibrobacter sp. UWH4]
MNCWLALKRLISSCPKSCPKLILFDGYLIERLKKMKKWRNLHKNGTFLFDGYLIEG